MIPDPDLIVIAKTIVVQNPTAVMIERNPTEKNPPIVNGMVLKQNGQTQDEMIENGHVNDMIPENLAIKIDHGTNHVIQRGHVMTKLNEGMIVLKVKVCKIHEILKKSDFDDIRIRAFKISIFIRKK